MKTEAKKKVGKWKDLAIETMEYENESGASNSRVKTGRLRMSQELCEPHTRKLESTNIKELQKTAVRGRHCGPTSRSCSVRVHQLLSWEATLHVPYSLL